MNSAKKMIRVVLIEDDPMVRELHRQFVEKVEPFRVAGAAGNGEEGLELIRRLQPELAIVDMYMPVRDGIETLIELRRERIDTDVIAITAANDPRTIQRVLQLGALDYIIKPFKFERVKQALDHYVRLRSVIGQTEELSQAELDRMLQRKQPGGAEGGEELPKGLQEQTLKQILAYLKDQNVSRSAEEVAEGIGLARVTARRYLDYLEKEGTVRLDVQYGGVGRPVNRYRLA